jgi:hypothetical protein
MSRPTSSRGLLGFHRATAAFVVLHTALLAITVTGFLKLRLGFGWRELVTGHIWGLALFWAMWALHLRTPGRDRREWIVSETFLVIALLLTFSVIGSPLQYVILAMQMPLADGWLAGADSLMGVHVPTLVAWTARHPQLAFVLTAAYSSLLPQFVLAPLVLGCWYRDRAALWEYAWHFQFCLVAALIGLALLPAACAFTYYGFDSLLDQTRFIAQFEGLRNGSMTIVNPENLEGMITFPSFHAAGALLITWSFRRYPSWAVGVGCLNVFLIASTVLTGAHYAVDVIASGAVFVASVWLWRRFGVRWIESSVDVHPVGSHRRIAA